MCAPSVPAEWDAKAFGPTRILVDGVAVERPELRRARVRELLTMLVVRERVTRDQAMLALCLTPMPTAPAAFCG